MDRDRLSVSLGRRFARLTTNAVVRRPGLWRLFRGPLRRQFDRLAPQWDEIVTADHLAGFERALEQVEPPPRRALDLGTGTGDGAFAVARRFPEAEVVGIDLAGSMIEAARRKMAPGLADRLRFEVGDASALPFEDGAFQLVTLANMIPFFDELARVVAPGGFVVFGFSGGSGTPIYVDPTRLRVELERRGFTQFAELEVGRGTSFLARKAGSG
ncbi:MAG: methyltransferase domain-containing protein [Actinobacteria bacterium]|nr:MAG: methyltransferase domain-containing protein [Actinomycetota bacterium]